MPKCDAVVNNLAPVSGCPSKSSVQFGSALGTVGAEYGCACGQLAAWTFLSIMAGAMSRVILNCSTGAPAITTLGDLSRQVIAVAAWWIASIYGGLERERGGGRRHVSCCC